MRMEVARAHADGGYTSGRSIEQNLMKLYVVEYKLSKTTFAI